MLLRIKLFTVASLFYIYNHLVTNIPIYAIRCGYLSYILRMEIGKQTAIHMGCFFTGNKVRIGNNSVINRKCYIDGRIGVTIGNNVSISPETYILTLSHDVNDPDFKPVGKNVLIHDYVWIGVRTIIHPGVELAQGTVVGSASVVTKSVFDNNQIIAGVPAKIIGKRDVSKFRYTLKYFPLFDTDVLL
jgi:acetyltransferase-like isoleucine patch superfamily enzyme